MVDDSRYGRHIKYHLALQEMAETLKEYSPNHQTLDQLAAASDQLNLVKDKLQRQQQAEAEKLAQEQKGEQGSAVLR